MKLIKLKSKKFPVYYFLVTVVILASTWLFLNLTAPKIPILGFHGIVDIQNSDKPEKFLSMDYAKQDLEIFLDYLISQNYWFLSTQELYDYFITQSQIIPSAYLGRKPVMLAFDDGYKTVHTHLMPILERLEVKYGKKAKVVLFIISETLNKRESINSNHMSCNELKVGLQKNFYDIQSHSKNHKKLTDLKPEELTKELLDAQVQLRKCTEGLAPEKQVASHIAYPYGATNKRVEKYASKYYLSAFLYNHRNLKLGWLKSSYRIPRLCVNLQKTPNQLIRMAEKAHQLTEKDLKISS